MAYSWHLSVLRVFPNASYSFIKVDGSHLSTGDSQDTYYKVFQDMISYIKVNPIFSAKTDLQEKRHRKRKLKLACNSMAFIMSVTEL